MSIAIVRRALRDRRIRRRPANLRKWPEYRNIPETPDIRVENLHFSPNAIRVDIGSRRLISCGDGTISL